MVLLEQLKAKKSTAKDYRRKFEAKDGENLDPKVEEFIRLVASRIRDGLEYNFEHSRLWWAIDRAYDAPMYQTTYTMLRGLIDGNRSNENVLAMVKDLGLSHMLTEVKTCNCTGNDCRCVKEKRLDLGVFTNIFIPAVMAYHTIRVAKIFGDRDTVPVFHFDPVKMTLKNRLRSEILTDRIEYQSCQYGYRSVKRQAIHAATLYGVAIQFPMEAWHREKHLDENGKPRVVKEGIRYTIPHPSRTFCDLSHRPDTINSDTGSQWQGYWHICRYAELYDNPDYWNKDRITYGPNDYTTFPGYRVYRELFPCAMSFPDVRTPGQGDIDRENQLYHYSQERKDEAVVVTELFMKFAPKDHGLGEYEYPVWHRIVMGNDRTVLYCEPMAYRPATFYGCDSDGNRSLPVGLGLQILPFQDMLGNYFSQLLLSVKSNLRNCIFYDRDIVEDEDMKKVANLGDKWLTQLNFIPSSARKLGFEQRQKREAFHSVEFPKHNVLEIASAVRMLLDMLERVLGFSAQEIGQAASHEQSATELQVIAANTSVRVAYTAGFIDDGIHAWKEQLYQGLMAYSDDKIFAQVALQSEPRRKALEEIGFKIEEEGMDGETKAGISGPKSALDLGAIATRREGSDSAVGTQSVANELVQLTQAMMNNPVLFDALGVRTVVEWFNHIALYAGLPKDFKIAVRSDYKSPQEQQEDVQNQLAQIAQNVVNQNMEALTDTLRNEVLDPIAQQISELRQAAVQGAQRDEQQEAAIEQIQRAVVAAVQQLRAMSGASPIYGPAENQAPVGAGPGVAEQTSQVPGIPPSTGLP